MRRLEQRPFGRTGERVTALSLGGCGLPRVSFADGVATVHRALELGINYFDTAPLYSRGVAQAILGVALEGRPEPHLVSTKLGHLAQPSRYRSPDALHTQLEENLRVLRRESVDVLLVHEADHHYWWSDEPSDSLFVDLETEPDVANAPVMQVLREAQAAGRCRHVGITGNNPDHLAHILRAAGDSEVDVCLSALAYGLIDRHVRGQLLPVAGELGIAIALGGVFRRGQLVTIRPEWLQTPAVWPSGMTPEEQCRVLRLVELQRESRLSLVTLTLRYLVADQDIATILVGAATPAEIEESVAAVQAGPLAPDLHQAVEALGLP